VLDPEKGVRSVIYLKRTVYIDQQWIQYKPPIEGLMIPGRGTTISCN